MAFRHLNLKQGKIFDGLGKKKKTSAKLHEVYSIPHFCHTILGILQFLIAYLNILQRKSRGV